MSVKLVSCDGAVFKVEYNTALLIGVIKKQVQENSSCMFTFPTVNGQALKNVVRFITYERLHPMRKLPEDLCTTNIYEFVDKWHGDFITSLDYQGVFEMILAGQQLEIFNLLELACAIIAPLVLWKTPNQIRDTFNIAEEFTPEQEALIREENQCTKE